MDTRKRLLEISERAQKKPKVNQPLEHHHGLYNQGATCYLNSVLQILFMTTEIHDRLDPKSRDTDKQLQRLFEKLKKGTCGTEKITACLGIRNVHQQRDAAECLEMILRKISPEASKVFKGQLKNTITCSKGDTIIEETDPFLILPLSLKDANRDTTYNVKSGIEDSLQTKSLSGDNAVYCETCDQMTDATSKCEMVRFPHILVLLLKRFDNNDKSYFKTDCCVKMPRTFQRKNKMYKLYGIVNHMGGLRGGHYTATILSEEDNTWYDFNDHQVKKVKEQLFADSTTYKSRTAYLLVYRASKVVKEPKVKTNRDEKHQRKAGGTDGEVTLLPQNPETNREMPKNVVTQRRKGSNILKKPLIIALIAGGCLSVVIIIIVILLTQL